MNKDTRKGVNFLMYGLGAHAFATLISAAVLTWTMRAVDHGNLEDIPIEIACFGVLIGVVALILFLIGIYKLWTGSSNLSDRHRTKIKLGIILLVFGFLLGQILDPGTSGRGIEAAEDVRSMAINAGVYSTITSAIFGSGLILLVYEISSDKNKKLFYGALGFLVLVNVIFIWRYSTLPTSGELEDVVPLFVDRVVQYNVLEFFALLLFTGGYYMLREDLLRPDSMKQQKDVFQEESEGFERKYKLYPFLSAMKSRWT